MEEKTSIILSHRREGMSIREIARRNGMSRKTVRKYLREFEKETGPFSNVRCIQPLAQFAVLFQQSVDIAVKRMIFGIQGINRFSQRLKFR